MNLCKTNPGKEKQEVEEIRSRKMDLLYAQKSECGILNKQNSHDSMTTGYYDAGKKRVTVTIANKIRKDCKRGLH